MMFGAASIASSAFEHMREMVRVLTDGLAAIREAVEHHMDAAEKPSRDRIAALAMQALLTRDSYPSDRVARDAYSYADSMLAKRHEDDR